MRNEAERTGPFIIKKKKKRLYTACNVLYLPAGGVFDAQQNA